MRIGLKVLVATILCAHTATVFVAPPAVAQKGHGEIDYGIATNFYKNKNYQGALEHFRKSLEKGNNTADNWIYIGHCYAFLGKRAEAISVYKEVQRKFKGTSAEKLATQCIARLDGSVVSGAASAGSSSVTSSSFAASSRSTQRAAGQGLINRINVIAPTQPKHPPVSSSTVGAVKTAVSRLPRWVYSVLDEGGVSINIAPNITDVWPEKGRQSMPGAEQYTLDQEEGRTEGREVFIWERQAYGDGDRDLREPQSQEELTDEVNNQLAHALDSCLGVSASPEFKTAFDLDKAPLSKEDKQRLEWFVHSEDKSGAEVCALVIESQALGEREPAIIEKHFGRCKAAAKTIIDREYKRRAGIKDRSTTAAKAKTPAASQANSAPLSTVYLGSSGSGKNASAIKPKQDPKSAIATAGSASKADSKEPTLEMPPEERIPYTRGVYNHLYVNGAINGRATKIMIDTGAYTVLVGKDVLQRLGIKTPTTPRESIGSGAAGALHGWDMELEISVGRIKRKMTVKVLDGSQDLLLGQEFLRGMHYKIDNVSNYIHFTKDQKDMDSQMSIDTVEIPFRMSHGTLLVSAKVNGVSCELNFDTGAPYSCFTIMDMYMFRLKVLHETEVHGIGGSGAAGYECIANTIELGPIRKNNLTVAVSSGIGGSILGQDFFGHMKYIIDNERKVIRIQR